MEGALRIARVAGIDIRVHYTWTIAVALISWSLAEEVFPLIMPGLATGTYWLVALSGALLLFVSVLAHELSHSLVAKGRSLPVQSITLFILGGVSAIGAEARNPRDELLVAIVGPLTSLLISALCWLALQVLPGPLALQGLLWFLLAANLLLAIFNLLPGFPLDGGRVLRAALWGVFGSLGRATTIASYVGQAFGLLLVGWGVVQLVAGSLLGGLWIALVGWFILSAAEASLRQVARQESFRGRRVSQVMLSEPPTVSPSTSLAELVHDFVFRRGRRAVPVVEGGRLVGIATTVDIRNVPVERWEDTAVRQIMTRQPLHTVQPQQDLEAAARLMTQHDVNQVPVVDDGHLVGMLSRAEIVRYLELAAEMGLSQRGDGPSHDQRRAA